MASNVPTEADLIFLGSNSLECLKQHWESEERTMAGRIKTVRAQVNMLNGKTVGNIKAMAAMYEHPKFPEVGIFPGSRTQEPEPLDADSINRKHGMTTFNFCGWCKHCINGTQRCGYDYYITATCPLIPKEFNDGSGTYGYDKFHFNTPCAIANGTQEFLETCVEYLKTKLAGLVAKKAEISEYVKFIAKAMEQAEKKPCLAGHRPLDWFKLGDEVVCFISKDFENALKKGIFVTGKVIDGYRHGDDYVSIYADEQVHTDDCHDGFGLLYGLSSPNVMHRWEYEYLKAHPAYFKIWIRENVAHLTKFNPDELIKAFAK